MKEARKKIVRHPLKVKTKCVANNETLLEHIESSAKRGLPELQPSHFEHNGVCVLVGSGPSVSDYVKDIKERKKEGCTIIAIKGANDWLLSHDIVPHATLMVDPQAKITNCIKTKHDDIIYMIASQCHPEVFDDLKGSKVLIWHAWSLIGEEKLLLKKLLIGGGTTTGLRAFNLMWMLGYRRFILYGYDSCVRVEKGHEGDMPTAENSMKRVNGDKPEDLIDIYCGKERFWTNAAMAAQANEFQTMMGIFPGIHVQVEGGGIIAQILIEIQKENERNRIYIVDVTKAVAA